MKTATEFDLHAEMLGAATDLLESHIEHDDGERCFNLYTYLSDLTEMVARRIDDTSEFGQFQMRRSSDHIARYLWCCVALSEGHYPDCTNFRGMPILD